MRSTNEGAWLLGRIFEALGAGSVAVAALSGCGGHVTKDPESGSSESAGGAGGTGGGNGGSPVSSGGGLGASGSGGGFGGFASSSTGSGVPGDCEGAIHQGAMQPEAVCEFDPDEFRTAMFSCLAAPAPPETCASTYTPECVVQSYACGLAQAGNEVACGPFDDLFAGACCYVILGDCPVGRPFTVAGVARTAAIVDGSGWSRRMSPDRSGLDATTLAALADFWSAEARTEHASIASFSRFVLELLAVGAPADLVAGAQTALADEIEHARIAVGFASAYAGRELRPSRLDVRGALDDSADPAAIAASVASEGCIAETIAALIVAAARDQASDPAVKIALAKIADEEMEHALLAWRFVRWALDEGGAPVRAAVRAVFQAAGRHVGFGATTALRGDAVAMRAHGYLPEAERSEIALAALRDVIAPAAAALLEFARRGGGDLGRAGETGLASFGAAARVGS